MGFLFKEEVVRMSNKGKYYVAQQRLPTHPANRMCTETLMRSYLQMRSQIKSRERMTYTSRQERMKYADRRFQGKSRAAGITPKEFRWSCRRGKSNLGSDGTSYDNCHTTDADHGKCVKKILKKLYDQGDIYRGAYEDFALHHAESFWARSSVDGKCPDLWT